MHRLITAFHFYRDSVLRLSWRCAWRKAGETRSILLPDSQTAAGMFTPNYRAELANELRRRGHCIKTDLTKAFRRSK